MREGMDDCYSRLLYLYYERGVGGIVAGVSKTD